MDDYNFLNPTAKYKEYLLLSTIEEGLSLTQREIAKKMEIAVSMVNSYLNNCLSTGLVERIENSKKDVKYHITDKGITEKRNLNIEFLKASLLVYNRAKENIQPFFNKLKELNYKNIVLYGAGEVCEMLLNIINTDKTIDLNVLFLVDDDLSKVNTCLSNIIIKSPNELNNSKYDCVVISSYNNSDLIFDNLKSLNIPNNKIIKLKGDF